MFPLAFLILPRGATLGVDPGVLFRLGHEYPEPIAAVIKNMHPAVVFRNCH